MERGVQQVPDGDGSFDASLRGIRHGSLSEQLLHRRVLASGHWQVLPHPWRSR